MKGDQGFGLQTKQKRSYCQFLVSPYELFNCSYLIAGNHTKEQAFCRGSFSEERLLHPPVHCHESLSLTALSTCG